MALILGALMLFGRVEKVSSLFWGGLVGLAVVSGWAGTAWLAEETFDAVPVTSHSFA
ncbi:MAG: YeeE/YedE family protein, partial [Alphaproteobacteria bacterium]